MTQHILELYRYRELLFSWTARELRLRYKQSLLGGVWAVLQPLILMGLFVVVFSFFVHVPTDDIPPPIFTYTALLPWIYFATALSFGVPSLVMNMNLVTKIYFPREILPLASIGAAFIDFGIASGVLVLLMLIYRIEFQITLLWLPVLILVQTIFTVGLTLFAAMLNAFYRDVRFMIPLIIQVWMYITPIIYPLSAVPEWLRPYYLLNPMAGLIDSYRRTIIQGLPPNGLGLALAFVIAVIVLVAGYSYFKRSEGILPDVI
jgi:lipopolysaccharide transport system permease protein